MRVAGLVLVSTMIACGGSDSPTPPPPGGETGTVTGSVTLNGVGTGSGSIAATSGSSSKSATPASNGTFSLTGLAAGTWSLQFTPGSAHRLASGETGTRTATVTANQTTTVSAFQIAPNVQSGLVEVHLTAGSVFSPSAITITPGTTVRWINDAPIDHTITPENASQPGVWARRTTNTAGVVFEHTFTVSGQTYRYRCEPHSAGFDSGMVGVIVVT